MMKSIYIIVSSLALVMSSGAQTVEEFTLAASDLVKLKESIQVENDVPNSEVLVNIQFSMSAHALALNLLSAHLKDIGGKPTDAYLKSCKILSNQTFSLVTILAVSKPTFKNNQTISKKLEEFSKEYLKIYLLLEPAVKEFMRRDLTL